MKKTTAGTENVTYSVSTKGADRKTTTRRLRTTVYQNHLIHFKHEDRSVSDRSVSDCSVSDRRVFSFSDHFSVKCATDHKRKLRSLEMSQLSQLSKGGKNTDITGHTHTDTHTQRQFSTSTPPDMDDTHTPDHFSPSSK